MTRETSARALWLINGLTLLAAVIFLSPVLYSIWMSFQTSDAYYSGGVDFTLFQCMDAGVSMVAGLSAGVVAEHLGYAAFFGISCGLSLAVLPAIWRATARHSTTEASLA